MTSRDLATPLPSARSPHPFPGAAAGNANRGHAVEAVITGLVQGVGFRPFVHRLAERHGIAGWVRNEPGAVRVHAEGEDGHLEAFLHALPEGLPPLARVDALDVHDVELESCEGFAVADSDTRLPGRLPVSPDVATCDACASEVFDPSNRRYRYPFITCTDCGPRFTLIEEMPYDRERTSMKRFPQCPECAREYETPADRRYRSETNSCPACGPRVWLETPGAPVPVADPGVRPRAVDGGAPVRERVAQGRARGDAAIAGAADVLRGGGIVAVRGLGGFHLAVRADDEVAVARLRERKSREAKPLAVMVADLDAARRIAVVGEGEARLLASPSRPVVVLDRRPDAALAPGVSPGLGSVGLMLPYTPLHHLLLQAVGGTPLVMTSGNVSDEPIAIGNDEARARLYTIADAFLLHDREIVARYDDSVVRVAETGPIVLRRSRGYAPMPLRVPTPTDDAILAVGPHLKNTFTVAQGSDAYVSQHIGDLENLETLAHFDDARARFEDLFHVAPHWVVRDLHPGYLSTRIAEESGLLELPAVQHHHAHIAAVMAEHGVTRPVLGLAFDGTGYGTDGCVWGCEFLVADLRDFDRVGHLRYAPLPGGDRAVRTPWRALLGYASLDACRAHGPHRDELILPGWVEEPLRSVAPRQLDLALLQVDRSLNAPLASSMGRLFDAAAAVLGIRMESRYEGQAAMELEAHAGRVPGRVLPFPIRTAENGCRMLDPVPLLRALAEEHARGRALDACAADFHESVSDASAHLALDLCEEHALEAVALGGGCFQNARLLDGVASRLSGGGVAVLVPRALGPNDGAVSYGQAAVAAARLSHQE